MSDENLRRLRDKVDGFSGRIEGRYETHMRCGEGCSACCQQTLSLLPVELAALEGAVARLSPELRERLKARLDEQPEDGPCPFLQDDRCVVYEARPIICRSHGLPLLVRDEAGGARRDVCPLNFAGPLPIEALPGTDLLDLERLNEMVILVNRLGEDDGGRESVRAAARRWLGVD